MTAAQVSGDRTLGEYRITISPVVFLFAVLVALLITLATISFQAIRAARAKPVDSLRTE